MKPHVYYLVLVTAPDKKAARTLAQAALKSRRAACVNLIPRIESHYWWKGTLDTSTEVLMIFKTTRRHLPALKGLILARHPYETPEFIPLRIASGSAPYLRWIAASVS